MMKRLPSFFKVNFQPQNFNKQAARRNHNIPNPLVPSYTKTRKQLEEEYGINLKLPSYRDEYNKHRAIIQTGRIKPKIASDAFIAPNATIVGNVEIWDYASVWYDCVIKGDSNLVRIGNASNIQDGTVIEQSPNRIDENHDGSTIIGHSVTVGHSCFLNACTIESFSLVGMNCILYPGSYMEYNSMLGSCSVLYPDQRVPTGELWLGNPAKFVRHLTPEEIAFFNTSAENYHLYAKTHNFEQFLPYEHDQIYEAESKGFKIGFSERDLYKDV